MKAARRRGNRRSRRRRARLDAEPHDDGVSHTLGTRRGRTRRACGRRLVKWAPLADSPVSKGLGKKELGGPSIKISHDNQATNHPLSDCIWRPVRTASPRPSSPSAAASAASVSSRTSSAAPPPPSSAAAPPPSAAAFE
nr:unnamed protein product [Digitaria exilis]